MDELPHTLEGRYRVEDTIGEGGMGRVYRGWDLALERPVAVKMLAQSRTDDDARERFAREAAASARLGHEHIVTTYDVVDTERGLAMVMELVDGPSLLEVIEQSGPLPPEEAARCASQLARGLSAVHGIGIVHRDLKPANLLLEGTDPFPRLKIADFGIASLPHARRLTHDSAVLGTPEYMAPERFFGHRVVPTLDVYSFGAILYEMVLGDPPVVGDSPVEVIANVLSTTHIEVRFPASYRFLEPLAAACLSFDPAARPPDGLALVNWMQSHAPVPETPANDGAIVVVGGLPFPTLRTWAEGYAEVGQTLGEDLVLRFESAEIAFRWIRQRSAGDRRLRAAFDAGSVVGAGVGLFAGSAVGRAARLVRIAKPGEVLVGPGGRRAIGLGLRASLEPLGTVHLAGEPRDTKVHRILRTAPPPKNPVSVDASAGEVVCRCGYRMAVPSRARSCETRIACARCGRAMTLKPPPDGGTFDAPPLTQDMVRFDSEPDTDDELLKSLAKI